MYFRVLCCCLLCCLCGISPVQAQHKLPLRVKPTLFKTNQVSIKIAGLQRRLAQAFKQTHRPTISTPQRRPLPLPAAARTQAANRRHHINSGLSRRAPALAPHALDELFLQTVARLENPALSSFTPMNASAFFIEADWNGQKRLLGVTVAHAQDIMFDNFYIFLRQPSGEEKHFPVKFITSGTMGRADVALFDVPPDAAPYIRPLPLATQTPSVGEKVRSYGFFQGSFRIVPNRTIKETTPGRLITSFEFGGLVRAGACGGPLLNKQNQVVGVHCGSSTSKKESYAVPVRLLADLVKTAKTGEMQTYDLVLSGRKIGTIRLDEYIAAVNTQNNGKPVGNRLLWHDEKAVDYQHLENLLPLNHATDLSLLIIRGGPEEIGAGVEQKELLSVHLPTGEVTHIPLKIADL